MIVRLKQLKSLCWKFYLNWKGIKGCLNIIIYKTPIIKNDGGTIIENNVTLHSNPKGYHALMGAKTKLFAERGGKILIGENSRINGACIHSRESIHIGRNCLIASGTSIIDTNGHSINPNKRNLSDSPKKIIIEDNVWIGLNCVILKGVTIGENSVISANLVINKNIPKNTIVRNEGIKLEKLYEKN